MIAKLRLVFALSLILRPSFASTAGPQVYEAEAAEVGRTTSGPATRTESDARASETYWVRFTGEATGDWVQFTLPAVQPGRYALVLTHRTDETMGRWRVEFGEADGSKRQVIHAGYDMNEFPEGPAPRTLRLEHHRPGFRSATVGAVELAAPGYKTLRFTSLERDGGARQLGIDTVALVPDFTESLLAPGSPGVTGSGPFHVDLEWTDPNRGIAGHLIERRGLPNEEWTIVGHTPAGITRFVSTGLRPATPYEHRVRAFTSKCLSEPSAANAHSSTQPPDQPLGTALRQSKGRIGEGTIVALNDGRLLMYLNAQDAVNDFSVFKIVQQTSQDGGQTWSEVSPVFEDQTGQTAYLMPSLLRLADGGIGLSYCVRNQSDLSAQRVFQRSQDDGATWSVPVVITNDLPLVHEGRTFTGATGPHDRLVQLSNGDLLLPVHLTTGRGDRDDDPFHDRIPSLLVSATVIYRSSDLGRSWQRVFGPVLLKGTGQRAPYRYHWFNQVLSEPSLVESSPGHLLLFMRNQSGFFQQATSADFGSTWSPIHQSSVSAPLSPPKLLKLDARTIALLFNPWVDRSQGNLGARFALGAMVSDDDGKTWRDFQVVDGGNPAARSWLFCYPFVHRDDRGWQVYYFGPSGFSLMRRTLPLEWFQESRRPPGP